jgi:uncharacterized protein (TIGR03086 family)
MSEVAERYRKVAGAFTARAEGVAADGWDAPTPCSEWVVRDIVSHMVGVTSGFLGRAGVELAQGPSADADPLGAWTAASAGMQAALDDPAVAAKEFESPMGANTLEAFVGRFGVGDVLVHTWDLARATGQDERLDEDEIRRLYALLEANEEMIRQGTSFGPPVEVADDADEQTKLLAFTGRTV